MHKSKIIQELKFKAVRSGGSGGQHVNKVSTKVELLFNVKNSLALSVKEKNRIKTNLAQRITKENNLLLQCDETRSQHKNKQLVVKRFLNLIENALKVDKPRRKTKPTKSSIEKRLLLKQKNSLKKANRGKPRLD